MTVLLTEDFPGVGERVWWPGMAGAQGGTVLRVRGERTEVVRDADPHGPCKVFVAGERYLLRRGEVG